MPMGSQSGLPKTVPAAQNGRDSANNSAKNLVVILDHPRTCPGHATSDPASSLRAGAFACEPEALRDLQLPPDAKARLAQAAAPLPTGDVAGSERGGGLCRSDVPELMHEASDLGK